MASTIKLIDTVMPLVIIKMMTVWMMCFTVCCVLIVGMWKRYRWGSVQTHTDHTLVDIYICFCFVVFKQSKYASREMSLPIIFYSVTHSHIQCLRLHFQLFPLPVSSQALGSDWPKPPVRVAHFYVFLDAFQP